MRIFRCEACGQLNRMGATPAPGTAVCGSCKRPLDTSGAPQEVDGAGMMAAISKSPVPVLVDFWAPWCGPCRRAAPLLAQLAQARAGRVLVLKLNTDAHGAAAQPLGIQGIPTFILFHGGREHARQVGLPGPDEFASWIDGAIGPGPAAANP